MKSTKFLIIILLAVSTPLFSQIKDTMYVQIKNGTLEKILVEKVDSFKVNSSADSLLIFQKMTVFGDEVQIINRKSLSVIDSIYFTHTIAGNVQNGVFQSYTINGKDELLAFDPGPNMDSVLNFTLTGSDITRTDLNGLAFYLKKVKGVFTMDGTGVSGWPITFFGDVQFDSSFVIKNNPYIDNINAFQYAIVGIINGDLILENNPSIDFGWGSEFAEEEQRTAGFMKVTGVEGDLILKDLPRFGTNFSGLESVEYVGGDLVIDNCADGPFNRSLENFALMTIDSIGGNLVIKNNSALKSLGGLENIRYIGGNVTITNNGDIPLTGTSLDGYSGFCWVKDALDSGVIKEDAIITLTDKDDSPIDLSSVTICN